MAKYDFTKPSELYENRTYINKKGEAVFVHEIEDNGLGIVFVRFCDVFESIKQFKNSEIELKSYTMPSRIFCKEYQLLFDLPEIIGKVESVHEFLNAGVSAAGEDIAVWTVTTNSGPLSFWYTKSDFLKSLQERSEFFTPKTKKKERKVKEEDAN